MQITPRPGRFELSQIPVWWVVGVLAAVVVAAAVRGQRLPGAGVPHAVRRRPRRGVQPAMVRGPPRRRLRDPARTRRRRARHRRHRHRQRARRELGVRPAARRTARAAAGVVVVRRRHARQPADRAAHVRDGPRPRAVRAARAAAWSLPARARAGGGDDARQPGRRRLPRPGDRGVDAERRPRPAVARRRARRGVLRAIPRADAPVPVGRLVPVPRPVVPDRRRHLGAAARVRPTAAPRDPHRGGAPHRRRPSRRWSCRRRWAGTSTG